MNPSLLIPESKDDELFSSACDCRGKGAVGWGKWDLVSDLYRGGLEGALVFALAAQEMPM